MTRSQWLLQFERASRLFYVQWNPVVPRVEEMDLSLRWQEFAGQHNKKEEAIRREIQRSIGSPFRVVSHNTDWWMHLESFLKPGKQPSERTELSAHTELRTISSHYSDWKTSYFMEHWREYSEGSCVSSGEYLSLN